MKKRSILGLLIAAVCTVGGWAADDPSFAQAQTTVKTYCVVCHLGKASQAGFDLTPFTTVESIQNEPVVWRKAMQRVRDHEMPPPGAPTLSLEERERFTGWIGQTLHAAACADGITPAGWPVRRLNRNEYTATVRDLLNIHFNAGHALPADGAGGEGFDNAAETLFLSPIHAEKYLEAAREALQYAAKDPKSRAAFLTEPSDELSPDLAARRTLEKFLPRAFRRPVSAKEIERYERLFRSARKRGLNADEAILFALQGVLISPHFLFRLEEPNPSPEARVADGYAIASRLSYFLWGTMPDESLLCMAGDGGLQDPAMLNSEIARMLKDERSREFAVQFVEQWLGTRELGRDILPDPTLFPEYQDSDLRAAIRYEPILFFQEILAENHSLLALLDSEFTYVNSKLKRFYGLEGEKLRQQPVHFDLAEGSQRGGILSMAAVLAVSSLPTRTSPVHRGKWILEAVLGTPPPPPPPDVPELEENREGATPKSIRERLDQHRANPACAGCHVRMDPLGFGLESYDVLGRWRTEVAGLPIDARGELPDGTTFDGPRELKAVLLERKDLFLRNLTARMLGYALGRGLTAEDHCAVDDIMEQLKRNGYRAQSLIQGIVHSKPFLYQPGTGTRSP
jgi:uncharacterized protein DUF1592/uncharacterized protein DUF1588/uncharacterized protein DUF1585/uncharacterized protein DUF1587/uncharacterized protein DUF1595